MTRVALAGVAALAAGLLAAVPQARQQIPTYRADARTVSVYATVSDAAGRLVPDLTRDDFEVLDNGVARPLTVFSNTQQPITVVMMLDRSGSVQPHYAVVRQAAEAFVGAMLPGDRMRIGSFSNDVEIDPDTFTGDRDVLVGILRQKLQGEGPTPLWNATDVAIAALEAHPGRRVVLLFSDGKDNPDQPGQTFADVRDRSRAADVMVYAVGLTSGCAPAPVAARVSDRAPRAIYASLVQRGRGGGGRGRIGFPGGRGIPIPLPGEPRPPVGPVIHDPGHYEDQSGPCVPEKPDPNLEALAMEDGGGYFELSDASHLHDTFTRVADELHHQYLLAFTPTALDGQVHTIEVRVKRPGMLPRARESYLAK